MSRSFVLLVTLGLGGGALGCSDPVPAAAAVGLRLNLAPTGSCAADNTRPDEIGNPYPDSSRADASMRKGVPVFDGEGGVQANCTITGEGPFDVTATARANDGRVILGLRDGVINANGSGTANMSFTTPAFIGGGIGGGTCSLNVVTVPDENGQPSLGIKAGAMWATFQCTGLTQVNQPSVSCTASGEVLLENCRQN